MSRAPRIEEGEWVYPVRRGFRLICCDCGLTHRMDFTVKNRRIYFRVFRDDRRTALSRRAHDLVARIPRRRARAR